MVSGRLIFDFQRIKRGERNKEVEQIILELLLRTSTSDQVSKKKIHYRVRMIPNLILIYFFWGYGGIGRRNGLKFEPF